MIDMLLGESPPDDWRVYSPVLRGKASEWRVLEELASIIRQRIAPIIEFVPDWTAPGSNDDSGNRRSARTPGEYVDRFLASSVRVTPQGARSFLYFGLAGPGSLWQGVDLWSAFNSRLPQGVRLIPLVDLASSGFVSLSRAVRSCGEIGLRLEAGDVTSALAGRIAQILQTHAVTTQSVHLVVDLKDSPRAISHGQIRAAVGKVSEFASIVVLAGVFPMDLTKYSLGVTSEPRQEWETWWREHAATPADGRFLAFGDYTTQYAHYRPSPEVQGSVSLRYTVDEAVLVFRGSKSNGSQGLGHQQMHGHCRLLVARSDYDGAAFSWGDRRVNCWTNPSNGTGNPMQWRTASIVHHITHVVVQLHDPAGSSASARAWARGQVAPPCP